MNTPMTDIPIWRKWWVRSKAAWMNLIVMLAGLGNLAYPWVDDLRHAFGPIVFVIGLCVFGGAGLYVRHKTAGGLSLTKAGES